MGDPYRAALPPRAASSWLRHPSSSGCSHQRQPPPSRHAATFPHPEAPRTLAASLREAALLGQETQKHGKKKNLHTSGSVCFSSPTCPASSSASCLESIAAPRIHGKKKNYTEKQQQGEPARKQRDGRSRRKASSALPSHEAGEEGRISLLVVRDDQSAPPPQPAAPCSSPRHFWQCLNKKKGKFYFLFLWSLIADQSLSSRCPGRQPGPALGPGLPAPSSSLLCFSCFHPLSPPDPPHRLLWESRGCSPATGNGGEFSGFTRPPQAPGGCARGSSIFPHPPPGCPRRAPAQQRRGLLNNFHLHEITDFRKKSQG